MKMASRFLITSIIALVANHADAEVLKKVYLDKKNNVHLVTMEGRHQKLTHKGNASTLKLAPDSETVAWLVMNAWVAKGDDKPGSEELVIYRNGKAASITCTPFIRNYRFWQNGIQVAIDCGGRRFAGREILYDARTLKELESFDQAAVPLKERPDWSSSDD